MRGVREKTPDPRARGFSLTGNSNRTRRVLIQQSQHVVAQVKSTVCQKMREDFSPSSVRPR